MNTNRDSLVLVSELTKLYSSEDTTNFNVFDFTYAFGSVLEAMAYAKLFWPDYIQVDGAILRSDVVDGETDVKKVRQALCESNFDIQETECSFNRLYIPDDLFGKRARESSDEVNKHFGNVLVDMWEARLSQIYPQFQFSVVMESDSDEAKSITFYRVRNGNLDI